MFKTFFTLGIATMRLQLQQLFMYEILHINKKGIIVKAAVLQCSSLQPFVLWTELVRCRE